MVMYTDKAETLLDIRVISKSYGAIRALNSVSLEIQRGEVVAVVGANGAGKSTLIRLLGGAERPDSGELVLAGESLPLGDPKAMRDRGVAVMYQDPMLVKTMSVGENIALGHEGAKWFGVLVPLQEGDLSDLVKRVLGDDVRLDDRVGELSLVDQQLVAMARGVFEKAQLFVMDEPTAALGEVEVKRIFAVIRELVKGGSSVLFISHRLKEVQEIADRIAVLRDGRLVFVGEGATLSTHDLTNLIARREEKILLERRPGAISEASALLQVVGLTLSGRFADVSFVVRRGEIVALLGLVGAGQLSVARVIAGATRATSGTVVFPNGESGLAASPADGLRRGISLVPESRVRDGILPAMSVKDNLLISAWCSPNAGSKYRSTHSEAVVTEFLQELEVYPEKCQDFPIRQLSGGNQQKIMLGRAVLSGAPILVLEEPTGGVDVGSKPQLHKLITSIAAFGRGVIVASSDPDEILPIADRVIVFVRGHIMAERVGPETSGKELFDLCMFEASFPPGSDRGIVSESTVNAPIEVPDGERGKP